jgi:hypothetical protein
LTTNAAEAVMTPYGATTYVPRAPCDGGPLSRLMSHSETIELIRAAEDVTSREHDDRRHPGAPVMTRVLVCGAGGFIGSHLVTRLKHEGYWLRGVDLKYPAIHVQWRTNS